MTSELAVLDPPAFPTLAWAVGVGGALCARGRRLRAGAIGAAAVARRWRGRTTATERGRHAAALASRLLAADGVAVDALGVVPARACVVLTTADDPRLQLAVVAAAAGVAVLPRAVAPRWLAPALGVHDDDDDAPGHAVAALRAGLPVVTTAATRADLLRLASLCRVPVVPVAARLDRTTARVAVRPPLFALPGEGAPALAARAVAELRA